MACQRATDAPLAIVLDGLCADLDVLIDLFRFARDGQTAFTIAATKQFFQKSDHDTPSGLKLAQSGLVSMRDQLRCTAAI